MTGIEVADLEPYLGKPVDIKARNIHNADDVWWYYGILEKITVEHVKLRFLNKTGFTFIPISIILQVTERTREKFTYGGT